MKYGRVAEFSAKDLLQLREEHQLPSTMTDDQVIKHLCGIYDLGSADFISVEKPRALKLVEGANEPA